MDIQPFTNNSFLSFLSPPNSGEKYPSVGPDPQLGPEFDLAPTIFPDSCNANINSIPPEQPQQQDLLSIDPDFMSSFESPTPPTVPDPAQLFESVDQSQFLAVPQLDLSENPARDFFPHPDILRADFNAFEQSPAASTANTTVPLQTVYHDILSSSFNITEAEKAQLAKPSQQTPPTNNPGQQLPVQNLAPVHSTDKSKDNKGARSGRKRTRTRTEDMDPSLVHTCPTCGKKFAKKYNQKIHQRRHQGDLPFVCEYDGCGKGFMWRSSFLRHLRVHEDNPDRPRKAARKTPNNEPRPPANSVDIMQVSEHTSIMLLNGMKVDIDHFGLESIRMASALCVLNGTSCPQILDMDLDVIRQADEQIIRNRIQQVRAYRSVPLNISNQLDQANVALTQPAVI